MGHAQCCGSEMKLLHQRSSSHNEARLMSCHLTSSHPIPSHPIPSHPIPSHHIPSWHITSHHTLSCSIVPPLHFITCIRNSHADIATSRCPPLPWAGRPSPAPASPRRRGCPRGRGRRGPTPAPCSAPHRTTAQRSTAQRRKRVSAELRSVRVNRKHSWCCKSKGRQTVMSCA